MRLTLIVVVNGDVRVLNDTMAQLPPSLFVRESHLGTGSARNCMSCSL